MILQRILLGLAGAALIALLLVLANLYFNVSAAAVVAYAAVLMLALLVGTEYRVNWRRLFGR